MNGQGIDTKLHIIQLPIWWPSAQSAAMSRSPLEMSRRAIITTSMRVLDLDPCPGVAAEKELHKILYYCWVYCCTIVLYCCTILYITIAVLLLYYSKVIIEENCAIPGHWLIFLHKCPMNSKDPRPSVQAAQVNRKCHEPSSCLDRDIILISFPILPSQVNPGHVYNMRVCIYVCMYVCMYVGMYVGM